ncbi:glycerophosphodiester phosphodiesterase family protein [Sphingomonas sp. GCM10030256]|uniref:glycerophosphodiester phosphodiesterase family protein n=1 Tax=Sphingomonas sp. GCM10030256 TaxID=3273427 RepID=UPI0036212CDB
MRLSPSATDPLDPGPKGFAHRGLHSGTAIPENSLLAFAAALELGAGIECDLRLTADGRVLVFHDSTGRRLCGSPLRISGSTHAELSRLRVGEHSIPTLESLFQLVGGRAPLLLEVKVERDLWRWVPALRAALADYEGRVGVMSFDPRLVRLLATNLPHLRRGLVMRDRWPAWKRGAALWLAKPDFLAVETLAAPKPWVQRQRRRQPVYSWTVRTAADRKTLADQVDALIWEDDGRP